MKRHHRFDSIAWWFALNVAGAITIAMLMSVAFVQFAGVWAQPPLENTGLIQQVAGMTRAMDQTPVAERRQLARRLVSPSFAAHWYPRRDLVPIPHDRDKKEHDARWTKITDLLDRPDAPVLTADSDGVSARSEPAPAKYTIAIELSDRSWAGFYTARRSWGIDRGPRIFLTIAFVLLSGGIIASVASRRLARPVQRFAEAAETFGAGLRAEAVQLTGPLEIREAAAAFNAMQKRIQQLMDSRTETLTAISHDLRAPLTRRRMRGEFIEEGEQRKLFRDVDEMQAMIEASLTFSRLDGQHEKMTRFELSELIHTAVEDFRDLGQPVTCSHLMPLVYLGRPFALKRVLTNLIDNAVKYGNRARITLDVQPAQVVIVIDDDGPGVPPVLIDKLFQPFFRIEVSRNRATGGYGPGLPSARSIVHAHGGEITLKNRQPNGLRATLTLPRVAAVT